MPFTGGNSACIFTGSCGGRWDEGKFRTILEKDLGKEKLKQIKIYDIFEVMAGGC